MHYRLFLSPLALAGAMLGVSTAAFAQSDQGPAPYGGQYQQNGPYQNGPGSQAGPNGQGPNGGRAHKPGPVQMALRSLDLSPDQKTQLRNLMREYRASHRAAQGQGPYQGPAAQQGGPAQGGPDQAQGPAPMSRKQMLAQVRSILTPDQQARFQDAMRQIRAERMQNGQGQAGPYQGGQQGGPGQDGPQEPYGPQGQDGPQGPGGPQGNS